ncbi:hypothetical protein OPQ81_009920 [Rhizoctonia solani]|nr:hypothetical protein OPQ81_009920 [Rhizoctonia solani]
MDHVPVKFRSLVPPQPTNGSEQGTIQGWLFVLSSKTKEMRRSEAYLYSLLASRAVVISFRPQAQLTPDTIFTGPHSTAISSEATPIPGPSASSIGGDHAPTRALSGNTSSQLMSHPSHLCDTPQSTLLPQNYGSLEISTLNPHQVGHASRNSIMNFLDEDEEEVTKTPEWIPEALELFGPYLPSTDRSNWLSALSSYFMFITRYVYESSNLMEATRTLSAIYGWVNSARLGLLGTAVLFHSYANPLAPQVLLRERSRQLIDAATTSVRLEMTQPGMPISATFAGISVVLIYHYYSGDLNAYLRCIETAVPMRLSISEALCGVISSPPSLRRALQG